MWDNLEWTGAPDSVSAVTIYYVVRRNLRRIPINKKMLTNHFHLYGLYCIVSNRPHTESQWDEPYNPIYPPLLMD